MERKEEKNLIQLSLNGDESAFAKLIRPYRRRIYFICLHILHDHERAEDLAQETFIHAYRRLSQFRQEARFYTWLYRIAVNLSLNALRKRQRSQKEALFGDLGATIEETVRQPGESREVERHELEALIAQAIHTLSPSQREVFRLHDIEGLPHAAIAAQLHIKAGTIRSRLHYARRRLRTFLKRYLE